MVKDSVKACCIPNTFHRYAVPLLGYRLGHGSGKDIAHRAIPLLIFCELSDGELICPDENFE